MSSARDYFPPVKYGAKWQPGDVVGGGSTAGTYGKVYWCIKSTGGQYERFRDDYDVKYADGNSSVQSSLTTAMALTKNGDVIYLGPGDWTGNYTTPANTVARDVAIIAMNGVTSGVGGRTWMGATTASSPIITVQARGWRISGIEFTPGATSSAITLSGTNANYFQMDNCTTYTGKYGLLNGGTHFVKVLNNHFTYLNATSSIAIGALTGIGGQHWDIIGNLFSDNDSHINFGSTRGLFSSRIERNTFIRGGVWTISTVLLDNRNTSDTGGTAVVDNFFDITKTQYGDDASTAFVRTQSRDWGAGNHCNDGTPATDIGH
jgi:hypothetical protein